MGWKKVIATRVNMTFQEHICKVCVNTEVGSRKTLIIWLQRLFKLISYSTITLNH